MQTILQTGTTYASLFYTKPSNLRKKFYPEGKKIVCRELVKDLDVLGLAVWIMDDGTLAKGQISIATNSFSKDDIMWLVEFLNPKWGFNPKIHTRKQKYRSIAFSRSDSRKISDMINSIIPDSMKYKLSIRGLEE